jgi:hypothetical protein
LGILGFILYEIEPKNFSLFIVGFLSITFLYSILYKKMLDTDKNSILLYIVSIIVYSFGPLIGIFPLWISALIFVLVIFLLNSKKRILTFHPKINIYELETFDKIITFKRERQEAEDKASMPEPLFLAKQKKKERSQALRNASYQRKVNLFGNVQQEELDKEKSELLKSLSEFVEEVTQPTELSDLLEHNK